MTLYMLDTNIVIHALRAHPAVVKRLTRQSADDTCISAITMGEVMFGFARNPTADAQRVVFREFLGRVDVLPWERVAADTYGWFRAELTRTGGLLSAHDLQIAAHALAVDAVLVTNDQAMLRLTSLVTEDWTRDV